MIEKALVPVSQNGRLAFAIACSEWVAGRLAGSLNHAVTHKVAKAGALGAAIPREYFWNFRPLDAGAAKAQAEFIARAQKNKNPFLKKGG